MDENVLEEWIEEVWLARRNRAVTEKSGLILDSARCHLTDIAKEAVKSSAHMIVVPGGLTKKLQPLDISVNKSFKGKIRHHWERWMIDSARHTYTKSGKQRKATLVEVCEWILDAWNSITPECIKNGFKKALFGEIEQIDSDQDDESDGDQLGIEEIPPELIDEMDRLQFIEDENFSGFVDHLVGFFNHSFTF